MKKKSAPRTLKTLVIGFGVFLNVIALAALVLYLAVSCTTARPTPAYHFKPGPSYLPGPKQHVHERYPNHP
jgi:hypothetical protein